MGADRALEQMYSSGWSELGKERAAHEETRSAVRALLRQLPRCEWDGCDKRAVGTIRDRFHDDGRSRVCDEHARNADVRPLEWAEGAARLDAILERSQ